MPKNLTTIYIVRHGQTEWNVQGLLQGHDDSPLTKEGEEQAHLIAKELNKIHFDEAFSSDLLRAKRTAEIIAAEHKLTVKTTKLLRERCFGKYEGKPYKEFNQAFRELIKKYENASDKEQMGLKMAPDIESPREALQRFIPFLREIAIKFIGKKVLLVTHGGILKNFLIQIGFATNKTLPFGSVNNLATIVLESDGVDFFIKETKGIKIKTVKNL